MSRALDLAELSDGDHLVDLGCGDGQVLVAAARRGARVTGVESDAELAEVSREALEDAGLGDRGDVVVGDLFDAEVLDRLGWPDVVFTYLSPATLQRLTPWLRGLRAARLLTVDFQMPDLVAEAEADGAHLYRLPGRRRRPRPSQVGWLSAGSLCIQPPDVSSLSCLDVIHDGGPVLARLDDQLDRHASMALGCDVTARGLAVAVDLRWKPQPAGTVGSGYVEFDRLGRHPVTVLYSDDEQGQWDLTPDGCTTLDELLRSIAPTAPIQPRTLLDALGV